MLPNNIVTFRRTFSSAVAGRQVFMYQARGPIIKTKSPPRNLGKLTIYHCLDLSLDLYSLIYIYILPSNPFASAQSRDSQNENTLAAVVEAPLK